MIISLGNVPEARGQDVTLNDIERLIIQSPYENGVFFCEDTLVGWYTGETAIWVGQREYWRMKTECGYRAELTYTHNHPAPYEPVFSPQDVEFAATYNLRELRVVGYQGETPYRCRARRPERYIAWPHSIVYNYYQGRVDPYMAALIRRHGIYQAWNVVFSEWGFDYQCAAW